MQETNQVTVSTWIKVEPGQFNQNWQPIISKGDAYAIFRNGPDSSNAMFRIGAGSATNPGPEVPARDNDAVNIVLDDGQWHQIVGTFDGLAVRIYVDGILERHSMPCLWAAVIFRLVTVLMAALTVSVSMTLH